MAGKIIIKGQQARDRLMKGILLAGEGVADTFGPRGRTFAWNKGTDTKTSKDGITFLTQIQDADEATDMGMRLVKEASDRANIHSGDGSTSTAILTKALCFEANQLLREGIDINDLRAGYKKATNDVLSKLETYKKNIESEDDIFKIAKVSANGDEEIASFVKDAFTQIGDDGLVSYADSASTTGKTFLDIKQGIRIDKGFISSKCVNSENNQCLLHNVKIVIFKDLVDDVEKLSTLLQMNSNKEPLLIVAPEYSDEVRAYYTKHYAASNTVFILIDGTAQTTIEENLEDLAIMSSSKIIGKDVVIEEYNLNKDAGFAQTVTITAKQTIVSDPNTNEDDFNAYINKLKEKLNNDDPINGMSPWQKEQVQARIAKMTGGIATIYIGALSKLELGEKKDRYDDAINAVRNALSDGIIIGGGTSLLKISYDNISNECKDLSPAQQLAYKAYMKAIRTPAKILIKSAGEDSEVIIPELLKDNDLGFNARTAKVSQLIDDGIFDPYNSIKNSIIYSSNMAEQFMSIDILILSAVKNMSIEPLDDIVDPGRMFNA